MPKEFRQCPIAFNRGLEWHVNCFCFLVIVCSLLNRAFREEESITEKGFQLILVLLHIMTELEGAKGPFVCCKKSVKEYAVLEIIPPTYKTKNEVMESMQVHKSSLKKI